MNTRAQIKSSNFLERLEQEARWQTDLHQHSPIPSQLGDLARFVATHAWQVIGVLSASSALIIWFLRH